MHVLIVDDDPEIRLIAGFLLQSAGHAVAEATDAADATRQLAAAQPDVVLMDVMLGSEDGIAVATQLLADLPVRPPLIFLTAATRPEQVERMRAAGAAGIVHKPFDPDTFVSTIERLV
ncbi:MAG TPA: response regulator [Longimicrobiales bacterium]|nr:response regulator [Longimicrobiales bacterium]